MAVGVADRARGQPGMGVQVHRPDGRRREMGLGNLEGRPQDRADRAERFVGRCIDALICSLIVRAPICRKSLPQPSHNGTIRQTDDPAPPVVCLPRKYVQPVFTDKHAKQWLASVVQTSGDDSDKPISSIEAGELLDVLQPLYVELPETARRIRQRLDTVFDHAVLRKLAPTNPAKSIVRALRQKREKGHFRALPYEEVHVLVAKIAIFQAPPRGRSNLRC